MSDFDLAKTILRKRGLHGCACANGHKIDLSDKPEVAMAMDDYHKQLCAECPHRKERGA